MSGYVIGSLIGAGAVMLGALLTAQRQKRTREAEREAAQRAELKNALREYLAALDALTNELADHPRQPKPTRLDRRSTVQRVEPVYPSSASSSSGWCTALCTASAITC